MSKPVLYLLLLIFLTMSNLPLLPAQRGQGRSTPGPQSHSLFELIPVPGQGYITVLTDRKESPGSVRLAFTGASEKMENYIDIPLEQRGLSLMVEGAFLWGDHLAVVTSLFYPGPQRDLLFIRRYSIPDFEEMQAEQVAEAYVPGRYRVPFGYALSPDSNLIMFYSWTYAVPEDPVKLEIHVLDRQLEKRWSKRFLLPNKNENFYVYACKVDPAGNAYLLCEDYKGKVGSSGIIRDEKIERFVLRLSENSNEATSFTIQLPERVITDLRFTIDPDGNLIGAGWCREADQNYLSGAFAYRIDHRTQAYQTWEFPLSQEDYWRMHPYAEADGKFFSGTRKPHDYFLDHLAWDPAQGLTLVSEQRLYEEAHYKDILVMQLDTSFRKQWAVRVPKLQMAYWPQSDFMSYQFLERAGKHYVIFNDHPENIPIDGGKPRRLKELDYSFSFPTAAYHLVQISDDGRLLHQDLSPVLRRGAATAMMPGFLRSDRQNSFLIYLNNVIEPAGLGEIAPVSWVNREQR